MKGLTNTERDRLEDLCTDHVWDCYKSWYGSGRKEPNLHATAVLDFVLQHGNCPDGLKLSTRTNQQRMVRGVLETARRNGRLGSSWGLGDRDNEVRCYEPAREDGETWEKLFGAK